MEFHPGAGDLVRLLRSNGFDLLDLVEVFAPAEARDPYYSHISADWAKTWPSDEIWRARKRGRHSDG